MKIDLAFKGGHGGAWTGAARGAALAATLGLGAAVAGSGACSAAPNNTDFGSGGAGSTQNTGSGNGSQSSGSQSGGALSGGTAGNSGVGTFVGSGGSGSGNNSTGVGGACASSHYEGKVSPLDIYIMLDKSGSMTSDNKWTNCTIALQTFVQSPEADGIGVGIQYFPFTGPPPPGCAMCMDCNCIFGPTCGCSGCSSSCMNGVCTATCIGGTADSCNPMDYSMAAVEIGLLPGNAQALINSINSITPNGGTPTRPALEGALNHARDWAVANTDHKVVVVLATDGEPTGCTANTIADSQNIAQQYLNGTPSVPTYVIGVGSSLTSLHAIAQSGGTNMAYIVDGGPNTTQQFLDAMNAIRQSAGLACEYQIPAVTDGGAIDPQQVNVQYIPGNGGPAQDILHAQSAADCHPVDGGWYYDNNAAPTKILICPATCTIIEADDLGKIDILFGCPTVNLPPH
jgi:Mg-chelatase subunit ChlD